MSDYFEWSHYNTSSYPISNPDPIGRMMIVNDDSNDWIDQMLQEIEEEEKEKEKNVEISELFNKIEISDCDVHSVSLKKPSVIQLNSCLSNDPHDEEVNFFDPYQSEDIEGENWETIFDECLSYQQDPEDLEYLHENNQEIQECPLPVSSGQD